MAEKMKKEQTVTITSDQASMLRAECQNKIDLANALNRLHNNEDFKKLVEFYCKSEPARLVAILSDASINMGDKKDSIREDIKEAMIGCSRFNYFINVLIYQLAGQATKTLQDLDKATIA